MEGTWSQHPHKNWTLFTLSSMKQHPSLLPIFPCVLPDLLRISITLDLHLQGVNKEQIFSLTKALCPPLPFLFSLRRTLKRS